MKKNTVYFAFSLLLIVFSQAVFAKTKVGDFKIINETSEGFIKETRFDLEVDGEIVPGILWTPQGAEGTRPLVVFGHGGRQHKRVDNILRSARDLVINEHYAVLAIDGPGHGDRVRREENDSDKRPRSNMTAETMAAITKVQALDYVGKGPIGYWGVSMGTRFGVPLVAEDDRFTVAIFGLFGLFDAGDLTDDSDFGKDAKRIDIPLMFVYQRSDELMKIENGLELYDAFGSKEKAMHINPGGHTGIPVYETKKWKPFFVHHLGKAKLKQ